MQNKHPKEIHVKVPDALGDTIISTAVIGALSNLLHQDSPPGDIHVYAKNTSLLEMCSLIDELHPISELPRDGYISLDKYLDKQPHTTPPFIPLPWCMIDEAESKLQERGLDLKLNHYFKPEIILTDDELRKGDDELRELKQKYGKDVVWISTKSSSPNKDWPQEYWKEVISAVGNEFTFLELLAPGQAPVDEKIVEGRYGLRETLTAIASAYRGITLDTFTLHAAGALQHYVLPQSVITLLGSSHPLVVSYPEFTDLFEKSEKTEQCQPCGNHGYFSGGKLRELERQLGVPFHDCSRCTFLEGSKDEYACMKQVTPEMVIDNLLGLE